ncbi:shikimate kinase [Bradyrhizobium sp. USDA 4524]|uniref:shikimate kinase n=1 Tax=unclassified Bradyrhizobium TaxID=2631580 RepID=UPI00209F72EA|nr:MULTISPECIES: shikimate kinase [unclassified Bradyrhizobium]MCP1838920.1 shikimate kinase [Bradyrhizobium sp. USDA 4538]MCP1899487.1 shikimate kinase [Bradyrhizobium sp. USDA 4537]MCP1986404.1 shikimate kinase [Bradyrhizobium sp. USDA 4539]
MQRIEDIGAESVRAASLARPYRRADELNAALRDLDHVRDIRAFSTAVVQHDKRLRKADREDHERFLEKAAVDFKTEFVSRLEENIRAGRSWGYATTCNVVSREAGGRAGVEACRALAARLSQLEDALITKVDPNALSLFALSFGRNLRAAECRNGVIRIAQFCLDQEGRLLQKLNSQNLSLLLNGISKLPDQEDIRKAVLAIAREVCDGGRQLARFHEQDLANLVNGFSKWPGQDDAGRAVLAIAREVCDDGRQLARFNEQDLANLVNGFSKWPGQDDAGRAVLAIAREVCDDGRRLARFHEQELANLVNGFSKWPGQDDAGRAVLAIAREVCDDGRQLARFHEQQLANLVNGFSKWPGQDDAGRAVLAIAREVCDDGRQLARFNEQQLANLVNGFSKWPGQDDAGRAVLAVAREVCDDGRQLARFHEQQLANLVNGFSKWPGQDDAGRAVLAIAREVCDDGRQLARFHEQELAYLVNGFSKWPGQDDAGRAVLAIAREVCDDGRQLARFNEQELANLVNGFSKWPGQDDAGRAVLAIAREVCDDGRRLARFNEQDLANLVNGFSKWPGQDDAGRAVLAIAREVCDDGRRLARFHEQELANLVNGFSKWPGQDDAGRAVLAIAREVCDDGRRLARFHEQQLANLVNGFSKWPGQDDAGRAVLAIAREVCDDGRQLARFHEQQLANLVNGFSKWPGQDDAGRAVLAIAREVCDDGRQLARFHEQQLANLVNGFSKWPGQDDAGRAVLAIAREVCDDGRRLARFNEQELANLVNGFSKWPEDEDICHSAAVIAGEVGRRALSDFTPQQMAYLMNGFSKWPDDPACHRAVVDIARGLGRGGQRFGAFTTPEFNMIANALGRGITRGEDAGEITETALLKDRLHQLAHHLHYDNDRLEQGDVLTIATIFKALAKARLFEDLGSLASTGLDRLNELHRAPGFAAENNLETMGNLCAALVPLARSPHLRWHRRVALHLLNDLQPVVEQKIEAHFNTSAAERIRGPRASRNPALSIYQMLKARAVLANMFKRPVIEGKKADLRKRQQELRHGTKEILAGTRDLIQGDLSNMSWNLIAQIEAESPVDALDTFVEQNAATIRDKYPASTFDVHEVLRAMDHEPRPPQGEAGLMRLPVVDMQGRPLATESETRYSVFHRLTSGAIEVVAVQLPAKPSALMLARTLTYKGVPYRMDLFGGSKLKAPRPTVLEIAAHTPGGPAAPSSGGKLLAIPYAETAPGTSFEKLLRAWAPFKEAYWYTQRRGFAAPPAIKDLGPHDYALEGAFKLLLTPDRPTNEEHPFKLTGPEGPIALRPHDGCGFIKASLAERMLAIRRAGPQEGPDRMPAYGEGRRSSVPASALQHYPRSEQVADEAREKAKSWLDSRGGESLIGEQLFRMVTAGHIDAPGGVAVPSSDDYLHVPKCKSETLTGTGGVLIGRSPYDKPNLRPLAAERVRSAADGDPTAAFLDRCVAMQYSFSVAQKSQEELAAHDPSFFAKGILIVVPDGMWPANYADRGLVMSAEDVKCHSSWTERKDRANVDTPVDCVGILQATEVFAPGSLVAVPTGEQKKLDGDFDGDTVVIIGDRPQLYEHVRQFDEKEQARGVRSLKPPKSYTPAIEGNNYQFSRASQILAATRNALEIYSGLQRSFLAQSHQARRWFAERAVFGTYEGFHHELQRDIRQLLTKEQVSAQDVEHMLDRARPEIKLADHAVAHEIAELLVNDLEAWAASTAEQMLPETSESVSDTKLTVSPALAELFPSLAETYPAAAHPRDRIQSLLDHYPPRITPRPDGYIADDLVQSASNLLSLGIKVGTDAFKSDTSVQLFMKKSEWLQGLLQQTPGLKSVPYVKSMAATLNHGRFNVDTTLEDLKDNPTLAASIMEASIHLAAEKGILPGFGRQPAEASAITLTLTREQASERAQIEVARAAAEEKEITVAARQVAKDLELLGIDVKMPHLDRRLRSESSLRDQLMEVNDAPEGASLLISSAVRHVFEVPDKDFARAFTKGILAFEEQGYAEISTTNWFRMSAPTFVGMKTVLATPDGYRFEAEFHTPGSYKAKIANHDTYKELQRRRRGDAPDPRKMEQLTQRVREVCKEVAIPEGVRNIPHFSIEGARTAGVGATLGLRSAQQTATPERSPTAKEVVAALDGRPIVLVGMPSSGKSTIGPHLARRLGLPFIDTDKKIEAMTRMSITEIFATKGEQYFRDFEASLIAECLERGPTVLATGGGAFMREETRHRVAKKGVSIWLNTDAGEIRKRLARDITRPLLQTEDREDKITQLIRDREPFYQLADLTIVPGKRNNRSADQCLVALHAHLCGEASAERIPSNIMSAAP